MHFEIQECEAILQFLTSANISSLYMQDSRYFREAIKATPDTAIKYEDKPRLAFAVVILILLSDAGKLHLLVIVVEYHRSSENSVIFNNAYSRNRAIRKKQTYHGVLPHDVLKLRAGSIMTLLFTL